MKPNLQPHHRHSIRLADYDYSQPGAYFITLVTHRRENLFGEIKDGKMLLNDSGRVVWEVWNALPERYPSVTTGAAVLMPNHFHGIVTINEPLVGVIPVRAIHLRAIHEYKRPYDNNAAE
jgi:putative transposase